MQKPLFEAVVQMRYGDQDVNQHINNVSQFRYLEEGRVSFFAKHLKIKVDGTGQGPVIAHTRADFLKELFYPGQLIVKSYVKRIGNSSYTLEQHIVRQEAPEDIVTRSETTIVWLDHAQKKSVPLPPDLRNFLSGATPLV